jgi:hypothetical protein
LSTGYSSYIANRNYSNRTSSYNWTSHAINIGLSPVLEYKLTKNITLLGTIGVLSCSYYWGENNEDESISTFNIGITPDITLSDITIGFYVTF